AIARRLAVHRDKRFELVIDVDAHPPADRADRVGWIDDAARVQHIFAAPGEAAIFLEAHLANLVDVSAETVGQIAEDSGAHHLLDHHHRLGVEIIFQHHVFAAVLFDAFDQGPAFIDAHAGWHFRADELAGLHRIDRHLRVKL